MPNVSMGPGCANPAPVNLLTIRQKLLQDLPTLTSSIGDTNTRLCKAAQSARALSNFLAGGISGSNERVWTVEEAYTVLREMHEAGLEANLIEDQLIDTVDSLALHDLLTLQASTAFMTYNAESLLMMTIRSFAEQCRTGTARPGEGESWAKTIRPLLANSRYNMWRVLASRHKEARSQAHAPDTLVWDLAAICDSHLSLASASKAMATSLAGMRKQQGFCHDALEKRFGPSFFDRLRDGNDEETPGDGAYGIDRTASSKNELVTVLAKYNARQERRSQLQTAFEQFSAYTPPSQPAEADSE